MGSAAPANKTNGLGFGRKTMPRLTTDETASVFEVELDELRTKRQAMVTDIDDMKAKLAVVDALIVQTMDLRMKVMKETEESDDS